MGGDFQIIYNEMAGNSANQTAVILNDNEEPTLIIRPLVIRLASIPIWRMIPILSDARQLYCST